MVVLAPQHYYYMIPEGFEVLPPATEMGMRLWFASQWVKGPRQLRG